MMGRDEAGVLARLKALRSEFLHPKVKEYGGRIVKTTGDGTLIEFGSAVDAVSQAVDVQRGMAKRNAKLPEDQQIQLRLGINVGDIIIDGDDIHGDGVNVAARLEGLSEPGGVCISGTVFDQVRGKLDLPFDDLGPREVKNIAEPVRVYQWRLEAAKPASESQPDEALLSPDKPSIAVLPFDNMSGDPEQEYFTDGLSEDLITALSYWRTFSVIARNSTFQYKGTSPDVRKVAKDLGVGYVLEGSVRKSGERVRITAQLIDGASGKHIWAEKYDRHLVDFFDLQDEITQVIAAKIEPEFVKAEFKRASQKPPTDLDAWELYQRGFTALQEVTKEGNLRAQEYFRRAITRDPSNSRGHTGLGYAMFRYAIDGFGEKTGVNSTHFIDHAKRAIALDDADAMAHMLFSIGLAFSRRLEPAITEARRAVELNPNFSTAYVPLGNALMVSGRPAEAIPCFETAIRLSPIDPRNHIYFSHLAEAQLGNRDYDAAVVAAERAIDLKSDYAYAHFVRAAALGHLNRLDEANSALSECLRLRPDYVENHPQLSMYTNPKDRQHILDGLRKVGLPE
jgi:adenylate cyclase